LVWGPGNSILGANNNFGLALNMALPIFWFIAKDLRPLWLKRMLQIIFLLSIPAVMFTYSRASTIALAVVLLAIALKGKRRILLLLAMLIIGVAVFSALPESWIQRQQLTIDYEQDSSATSRLDNWNFCWALAKDRPLTGGGFKFYSTEILARYMPEFLETYGGKVWDTHSIYFAILTAHGFPALVVFLAMIGSCILSCRQMKRSVRGQPELTWVSNYADMVQVSFIAFLVNGAFVNMEYFDLVYHWVAVVSSMKVISKQALAASYYAAPEAQTDLSTLPAV
jgi:probable O-glycosylation ligase (exosortase A-associated)